VDYGYLGVGIPQEGHPMRRPDQIVISSALPNGPAAKARLRDGDVITHINGVEVKAYEELYYHVGAALADNPVRIKVLRRPDEVFTVTLGKFRHEQAVIASVRPEPVFGLRVDYNSLLAQPGGVASLTGVPDGVCVREVAPDSPAAAAFKKLGDQPTRWLITSLNGTAVTTPAEFYKAAKGLTAVKLAVRDPFVPGSDREVTFP
jgi:serine protease Do